MRRSRIDGRASHSGKPSSSSATAEINDGVDRPTTGTEAWLAHVARLPQKPTFFHGTVGDNIRLVVPDTSDAAVERAEAQANAHAFIERLSDGYEKTIGDRGQGCPAD